MPRWTSLKWLLWIGLYVIPVLFLPWATTRAWADENGNELPTGPKKLFQRGELGLISMVLVSSVIWDLLQSQFMPHTVALGSVLLGLAAIMAVDVWVEGYCRQLSGSRWTAARTWRDSRNLALLVLSMAAVVEILLDRFAKVVSR